jgi:hypothetical protein
VTAHPAAAAMAAMLLAQAQPAPAGKALSLAELYGRTLGAAAQCPAVSAARLGALAEKAALRVKSLAHGPAEAEAAGGRLSDFVARGRRDVANGAETCAQAQSEFANLEHELGAGR